MAGSKNSPFFTHSFDLGLIWIGLRSPAIWLCWGAAAAQNRRCDRLLQLDFVLQLPPGLPSKLAGIGHRLHRGPPTRETFNAETTWADAPADISSRFRKCLWCTLQNTILLTSFTEWFRVVIPILNTLAGCKSHCMGS